MILGEVYKLQLSHALARHSHLCQLKRKTFNWLTRIMQNDYFYTGQYR